MNMAQGRPEIVILSGGLDSTVCMAMAYEKTNTAPVALSFDYGQRHKIELKRAALVAAHYGSKHLIIPIDMPWKGSSLTDMDIDVPMTEPLEHHEDDIPTTYVPARNIIFLSLALSLAEASNAQGIYIGVNALDYSGYPDCRPEFIDAFQKMANVGQARAISGDAVQIHTPLIYMTKAQIIQSAISLKAPLELTWSCYQGLEVPCGTCESCRLRQKGFAQAGLDDPSLAK